MVGLILNAQKSIPQPGIRGQWSGVKMLLLSQFFYYDGRVDTKYSDENSAVRDQGSGVRGQGFQNRG